MVPTLIVELIIYLSMKGYAEELFKEDCVVEWLQFSALLATSVLFYKSMKKHTELKAGFHVLTILPLMAAMRELDSYLRNIGHDAWKVFAGVLLIYMIYVLRKNRRTIKGQFSLIVKTRSFGLIFSGFLIVMSFSRLMGQKIFWEAVLQENYVRFAVRILEESFELIGYFLILMGAIEYLFETFPKSTKPVSAP